MDPGLPVVTAGSGVGVDLQELERGVLHPVQAADVVPSGEGGAGLEPAVGAARVPRLHAPCDDAAVTLYARADGDHRGLVGVAGGQLLPVGHDDFHRPPGLACEKERDGQVPGVALAAELAAHVHRVDADARVLHAEGVGQHPPGAERVLGGSPHLHAAVEIDGQEPGMGLQVALVAAGYAESVLQHHVGLAEPLFHVPLAPGQAGEAVAHVGGQAFVRGAVVAGNVVVQQRRIGLGGGHRIEHRRQDLIVHVNERQGGLGFLGCVRRHRRHPVADVPHSVPAQHRQIPDLLAHVVVRHVQPRNHGPDPRRVPCPACADGADARVGMRAAQDLAPEHPFARGCRRHSGCGP